MKITKAASQLLSLCLTIPLTNTGVDKKHCTSNDVALQG